MDWGVKHYRYALFQSPAGSASLHGAQTHLECPWRETPKQGRDHSSNLFFVLISQKGPEEPKQDKVNLLCMHIQIYGLMNSFSWRQLPALTRDSFRDILRAFLLRWDTQIPRLLLLGATLRYLRVLVKNCIIWSLVKPNQEETAFTWDERPHTQRWVGSSHNSFRLYDAYAMFLNYIQSHVCTLN